MINDKEKETAEFKHSTISLSVATKIGKRFLDVVSRIFGLTTINNNYKYTLVSTTPSARRLCFHVLLAKGKNIPLSYFY